MCTQKLKSVRGALTMLAVALLGSTAAGCGAQNNVPSYRTSSTNSSALGASSASVEGDWICPTSNYNIIPVAGSITSTMTFRACRSRTTPTRFLVSGSSDSAEVCFFPASRSSSGSVTPLEMPKCYDVTHGPVVMDFSTSGINYMISAARANSNALAACMTSSASCPAYSAGAIP